MNRSTSGGFRSLADFELDGSDRTVVLIGTNGSGKSNVIRFFEMLSWMLLAHIERGMKVVIQGTVWLRQCGDGMSMVSFRGLKMVPAARTLVCLEVNMKRLHGIKAA